MPRILRLGAFHRQSLHVGNRTHCPVSLLLIYPSSQNHLYSFLRTWNRHFDADRSGSIEGAELSNALRQFGYNLSPPLLQLVLRKYGEPH